LALGLVAQAVPPAFAQIAHTHFRNDAKVAKASACISFVWRLAPGALAPFFLIWRPAPGALAPGLWAPGALAPAVA